MPVFDSNCLYIIQCLALVFLVAPCVLFAGGMLICGLLWCGLRITRALNLRLQKSLGVLRPYNGHWTVAQ